MSASPCRGEFYQGQVIKNGLWNILVECKHTCTCWPEECTLFFQVVEFRAESSKWSDPAYAVRKWRNNATFCYGNTFPSSGMSFCKKGSTQAVAEVPTLRHHLKCGASWKYNIKNISSSVVLACRLNSTNIHIRTRCFVSGGDYLKGKSYIIQFLRWKQSICSICILFYVQKLLLSLHLS